MKYFFSLALVLGLFFSVSSRYAPPTDLRAVYVDAEEAICYVDLMAFDQVVEQISLYSTEETLLQQVNCLAMDACSIIEMDLSSYPADEGFSIQIQMLNHDVQQVKLAPLAP